MDLSWGARRARSKRAPVRADGPEQVAAAAAIEHPPQLSTQEQRRQGRLARRAATAAKTAARVARREAAEQFSQEQHARRCAQARGRWQRSAAQQQQRHHRGQEQHAARQAARAVAVAQRRRGRAAEQQRLDALLHCGGRRWPPEQDMLKQLPDVHFMAPDEPLTAHHYLGRMDRECSHCGALHFLQERLKVSTAQNPRFGSCCMHGQVSLPALQEPPQPLLDLLTHDVPRAKQFRQRIRTYNCCLQLASSTLKDSPEEAGGAQQRGVRSVRMHGRMYHLLGPLLAAIGALRAFAQLWIYDSSYDAAAAATARNAVFNGSLDEGVIAALQQMLEQHNPLVQQLQMALENDDGTEEATIVIDARGHVGRGHERQWNAPVDDQVAAIMPGDGNTSFAPREVTLRLRGGGLRRIHDCNSLYFAVHFVLLFPRGEEGWHPGIPKAIRGAPAEADDAGTVAAQLDEGEEDLEPADGPADPGGRRAKFVTLRQWLAYRMHVRPRESDHVFRSGRLFQEFACDGWATTEQQRLRYITNNQPKLRTALYKGVQDALRRGDTDANNMGRAIILPSSHSGSPRQMQQLYQDAMAIVRKHGKPDLFITMTCNPQWREIQEQLLPGQAAVDRPDLVNRVFKLKLEFLLDLLINKQVLGRTVAKIFVIEFQKRGLPHAHILLILAPEDKLRTPEDIDRVVSAELPDKEACPQLYEAVTRHMMHGPCGNAAPTAPCMEGGDCTKRFPRDWQDETTVPEDGYPLYRRRNNGHTVIKGDIPLDNRWVVPYNPLLLQLLQCHLNVEVVSSISAVKYLYKYVYKGADMVRVAVAPVAAAGGGGDAAAGPAAVPQRDEVGDYLSARYFSSPEALWRIFEYPLHEEAPNVVRLDLHLPDEQAIFFQDGADLAQLAAAERVTKLTAWFKLNQADPNARAHLYIDIPTFYTWHAQRREWRPRKRGAPVGRLYLCGPEAGERYCLRLLLLHVRGATSFEALRTVPTAEGDVECATFREACNMRGLLTDEREADAALSEAAAFQMPSALRQMFASLLLFTEVPNPMGLWQRHEPALTEDFLYQHRQATGNLSLPLHPAMVHKAQREVQAFLQLHGKTLSDYSIEDPPPADADEDVPRSRLLREHMGYNRQEQAAIRDAALAQVNIGQRAAFNDVFGAVEASMQGTPGIPFFLDGPGGTGKTFLYNALLAAVRARGWVALPCASSGLAANNMAGGKTAHSTFKIPLLLHESSVCNISRGTDHAELLREAALLIWDEAPMSHRHTFEALDRTLRDLTGQDLPFGGKVLVAGGDFRQILPVVRRASAPQIVAASLCRSALWPHFRRLRLTQNMRVERLRGTDGAAADDLASFANYLLELGDGRVQPFPGTDYISVPHRVLAPSQEPNDLIAAVFGDLPQYQGDGMDLVDRAILTPLNESVDSLNNDCMSRFPGEERLYLSVDSVRDPDQATLYPVEFLNNLTTAGLPPHELRLKIGAPIMLLRNINAAAGLANGTRLVVHQLTARVIVAKIATGSRAGTPVFIPRFAMAPSDGDLPFEMQRRQFPVRPAFVMSINKSQGQTLERAGVFLPKPVFTHGQLYVAFSRVGSWDRLVVCVPPPSPLHAGHLLADGAQGVYTKNIVYTEVLR